MAGKKALRFLMLLHQSYPVSFIVTNLVKYFLRKCSVRDRDGQVPLEEGILFLPFSSGAQWLLGGVHHIMRNESTQHSYSHVVQKTSRTHHRHRAQPPWLVHQTHSGHSVTGYLQHILSIQEPTEKANEEPLHQTQHKAWSFVHHCANSSRAAECLESGWGAREEHCNAKKTNEKENHQVRKERERKHQIWAIGLTLTGQMAEKTIGLCTEHYSTSGWINAMCVGSLKTLFLCVFTLW